MRPTSAIVDLNCLKNNIKKLMNPLPDDTRLMAVVKANGYGHGDIEISKHALKNGATHLGVALVEEGIRLREAGIDAPILILGSPVPQQVEDIIHYNLLQTVPDLNSAHILNKAAESLNKPMAIHLKLDTGMGRIGIRGMDGLEDFLEGIADCKALVLDGVFTHFSSSDDVDPVYTQIQIDRFQRMIKLLSNHGIKPKYIHAANSAATITKPESYYDMVRCGISMYGYLPSISDHWPEIGLDPVLSWNTRIVYIKDMPVGEYVSYGRTFSASRITRVATLPVGYADGYPRLLSNRGYVLVRGKRAPVIGRICMDQFMVDITDISGTKMGDTVVLLGTQDNETISADDLAELANTISYEILTGISSRVPRVYINQDR